jgi:hypothetical protein
MASFDGAARDDVTVGGGSMHPRSGDVRAHGLAVDLGREYEALRPRLASWAKRALGVSMLDFEDLHEEAWGGGPPACRGGVGDPPLVRVSAGDDP